MAGAFVSHGWLAAVLPAHARAYRVRDRALAYTLQQAGADLTTAEPEVEIGPLATMSAVAPTAIVPLNAGIADSATRLRQIVRRVAASVDVQEQAADTRAALEARGYRYVRSIAWDRDQPIHLDDAVGGRTRFAERFPRRALVVAHRERPAPTILDEALSVAGERAGAPLHVVRPLVASGTLVVLTPNRVLRLAVGPAAHLIEAQGDALQTLAAAGPPAAVSARIPHFIAASRVGLATWSLEERIGGDHPDAVLTRTLASDCVDFLATLYATASQVPSPPRMEAARQAELVAAYAPAAGALVRALARDVDDQVGMLRTGFWHGDFWMNNLLVADDHLAGVIDWTQGGPHGLPLLDLLNLELIEIANPSVYDWGHAIVRHLLPLADRGPGARAREYLRRTGVDIDGRQLRALIVAYWLERVHHHLSVYLDRGRDPLWLRRNVIDVATALGSASVDARVPRSRGPAAAPWPRATTT